MPFSTAVRTSRKGRTVARLQRICCFLVMRFATPAELDATVGERCRRLGADAIQPHTDFHWWPRPSRPN